MKFKLEFDNLKQIIKEKCKSKKVIYFPNPGNWGDGILRYATLKLFEDIDLEYKEIGYDYDKSYDGDIAIYGAGGAWCDIHPHGRIITENLLRDGFEVIVLPSTYAYKHHIDNYDISADGNEWSPPEPFFDEINKYSVIHTDRLHIGISACLLGKELHLYDGAYFKNLSLYLTSVLDNFDNVYFHEE
jgi:exopolysaccharide biosynthesis predicted pyruvyltransferase EpsI